MVMESSRWTEDTAALEDTVYNHPMAPNMQIAKAARMEMRDQYYKTFLTYFERSLRQCDQIG